jgi:hypothetical protein
MTFDEWPMTVRSEITADALWQMKLYPQALFLDDLLNGVPMPTPPGES